eukprot:COSAG03_NODE_1504_length_3971_cov_7.241219_2_plen_311_part_00
MAQRLSVGGCAARRGSAALWQLLGVHELPATHRRCTRWQRPRPPASGCRNRRRPPLAAPAPRTLPKTHGARRELDSAMGGSISSRCSTRAAPRHAGPAGREPGLYLVSAAPRAVAAVPRPARADLPGAPRTSRRCRLRRPRVRRRALKSSRCSTRAAPRHAGPAGREPGLYLVSAALRAVAAVPRPARADLPGAPWTSRRCRLRRPRVRRRALGSSRCSTRAAPRHAGPAGREPGPKQFGLTTGNSDRGCVNPKNSEWMCARCWKSVTVDRCWKSVTDDSVDGFSCHDQGKGLDDRLLAMKMQQITDDTR